MIFSWTIGTFHMQADSTKHSQTADAAFKFLKDQLDLKYKAACEQLETARKLMEKLDEDPGPPTLPFTGAKPGAEKRKRPSRAKKPVQATPQATQEKAAA